MFQLSIAVALVQQQQQSSQDVRHDGSRAGAGGGYLRALLGGPSSEEGPAGQSLLVQGSASQSRFGHPMQQEMQVRTPSG